ncbi:MAG: TatD family hydrolase [Spirochaetia bacterium]|nr:TatD family hydrolase [Spirochaetia bacterium]
MLVDAHCHCKPTPGVTALWNSVTSADWDRIPTSPDIIPFYGIHPWYAKSCSKIELMNLGQFIKQKKAAGNRFGIGETGLDKTDKNPDIEDQKGFFAFHLWLAEQYKVPVAVHCVHAWGLFEEILEEASPDLPLLMHSYSGSLETAKTLLKRNTWFSFSPAVQRIEKQAEILRQLPLERIFLETDLTDCTPDQHRQTLEELYRFTADIKGLAIDELKKVLENNLKSLFST